MLAGQGVVAIWNGITEEGRADFYEWHVREHMPERVGIPGFLRGRRYRALDRATQPEFFTLYETETFETLLGQDYLGRLNAPTAWTKSATAHFRDTSRGLARVLASHGDGPGGVLATVRFRVPEGAGADETSAFADRLSRLARLPKVTGVHLCRADDDASGVRTTESRDRTDIQAPPNWIVMIESCLVEGLDGPIAAVVGDATVTDAVIGRYGHEYTRPKNPWTAG